MLLAAGTKIKTRRASPEEDLQRVCFEWASIKQRQYAILKWLIHVPNGGKRPKGEAGKLKALGVKPGVPDILLPRPSPQGRWKGLAIELKSSTGRVSPDQREWLDIHVEDGWCVGVARTLDEFVVLVEVSSAVVN